MSLLWYCVQVHYFQFPDGVSTVVISVNTTNLKCAFVSVQNNTVSPSQSQTSWYTYTEVELSVYVYCVFLSWPPVDLNASLRQQ